MKADAQDGDSRGEYVNNSPELEQIHMKYAVQGNQANINSDAKCHYVAYVRGPHNHIIELDGRRPAPVVKEKCEDANMFHL